MKSFDTISSNGRTALIAAATLAILGGLYFFRTPSSSGLTMSAASSSSIPGLEFHLSQISRNPPSLLVTLKNTHPSTAYTLLKWGTPLDPQASNLGVFKLADAETGEEVPTVEIKIARKMPPGKEDLVTVAPGTEEATEVVFDKPWMPNKRPAKYRVKAVGTIMGAWEGYGGDLKDSQIEAYADSPLSGRAYESNEQPMKVD